MDDVDTRAPPHDLPGIDITQSDHLRPLIRIWAPSRTLVSAGRVRGTDAATLTLQAYSPAHTTCQSRVARRR